MRFSRLSAVLVVIGFIAGCGPTYPKEILEESLVGLCEREYHVNVKSQLLGRTLAVYIPIPGLFSATLNVSDKAMEKINDVFMSTSRVILSSDAEINFYCVIAQDPALPELQIISIKYVDDLKKLYFSAISRGEFFKRSIIDRELTPQALKEEERKRILREKDISPETRERLLESISRDRPLHLNDFGYWNGKFYVKDITLPDFLAEQIAGRIRIRIAKDDNLSGKYLMQSVKSRYGKEGGKKFFYFDFEIALTEILYGSRQKVDERVLFENIVNEIGDCLYGYKFEDFDAVKISDMSGFAKLVVKKEDIYALKENRLDIEALLGGL